ncbi:hypothetical protein, partial [uncultured Desulfovibrio sp.]
MPEKRLRGNGFPLGKHDMHRFKKNFSTIRFLIISIFCMISSFFSFFSNAPFMAENRQGFCRPARAQPPNGRAAAFPQRKGRRLPWHRPLRKMAVWLERGALQPARA